MNAAANITTTQKVTAPTHLTGEKAQKLQNDIDQTIDGGRTQVIVDLSQTSQVDSAGLSSLIRSLGQARSLGGEVVLLGPSAKMRNLLELTRIHRVMEIFDHESAASRFFRHDYAVPHTAAA